MNTDLLIKENKELNEEKQRYKEMWFTANNSLAKYRKIEQELGCPLEVVFKAVEKRKVFANTCWLGNLRLEKIDNVLWLTNGIKAFSVKLADYKKTWWLKEDKSE